MARHNLQILWMIYSERAQHAHEYNINHLKFLIMERKHYQRLMQEAEVEIERAINKGREAADKGMDDCALDNTSKMDEFNMFYDYFNYFTALHHMKLAMNSASLFKNYQNEE